MFSTATAAAPAAAAVALLRDLMEKESKRCKALGVLLALPQPHLHHCPQSLARIVGHIFHPPDQWEHTR